MDDALPSAPVPPADAAPRRPRLAGALRRLRPWARRAYYPLVAAVFLLAAWYRFAAPPTPFFDDDGWGYLWGPLRKLTGQHFEHIFAREYLYPAILATTLFVSGSFNAISWGQHALGLLGAGCLLGSCHLLAGIARAPQARPAPRPACWVGLALTAVYLFNRDTFFYEHTIRPEGIFQSLALASIFLNLLVIHGGLRPGPDRPARPWVLRAAVLNAVLTVALLLLRPSFRLSALAANVPFALLLLRREYSPARRLAALGVALLAGAALWLPESALRVGDRMAARFLGERLFSAHADLIERQIDADLAAGRTAPYDATWLRSFQAAFAAKLDESRRPEHHPWRYLGFNADHLVVDGKLFSTYFPDASAGDAAAEKFCVHYYVRAAFHQPAAMARKVLTQIYSFYATDAQFNRTRRQLDRERESRRLSPWRTLFVADPLASLYAGAAARLRPHSPFDETVDASLDARAYLARCQRLARSKATHPHFLLPDVADALCWRAHILLGLAALGCCAAWRWLARAGGGAWRTLAGAQALVFAYPLGICLATAISFYVEERYVAANDAAMLVSTYASGLFVWKTIDALRRGTPPAGDPASTAAIAGGPAT